MDKQILKIAINLVEVLDDYTEFIDHFYETSPLNEAFTEDGIIWEALSDYDKSQFLQMAQKIKSGVDNA